MIRENNVCEVVGEEAVQAIVTAINKEKEEAEAAKKGPSKWNRLDICLKLLKDKAKSSVT